MRKLPFFRNEKRKAILSLLNLFSLDPQAAEFSRQAEYFPH